jgi:hypothetical protein
MDRYCDGHMMGKECEFSPILPEHENLSHRQDSFALCLYHHDAESAQSPMESRCLKRIK